MKEWGFGTIIGIDVAQGKLRKNTLFFSPVQSGYKLLWSRYVLGKRELGAKYYEYARKSCGSQWELSQKVDVGKSYPRFVH